MGIGNLPNSWPFKNNQVNEEFKGINQKEELKTLTFPPKSFNKEPNRINGLSSNEFK